MPTPQKIRNWKEYNRALHKRGQLLFNFSSDYLDTLYHRGPQKRGGKREYTETMYEFLLTIKVVLRLPWRATSGFAESLLKKAFPHEEVCVPNYAHASREAARLSLTIKQYIPPLSGGMALAFDSTGVNVYTTSGWHQRKYGKRSLCHNKDQWKKIHIAMDLDTMQIMAFASTDSRTNDCEVIPDLCQQISGKTKSVRADGAYDTYEFYRIIHEWGDIPLIPPARTSKSQEERKNGGKKREDYLKARDAIIQEIRQFSDFDTGLGHWKKTSGYHRRSLVEACMCRIKRTFGFHLQHKTDHARKNELITKINVLNLMASLGRAQYAV